MARWRAFDRLTSVPKQRFSDEVILFSDADGAFKAVDEDGVVTSVGSGTTGGVPFVGVDPPDSPTDGELWWDPDDDTATSGGSQPSSWLLGPYTFTFEDDLDALASAGGVELFTPNVGDLVLVFHEAVAPWDSAPGDEKLSAFVRVGTFQGAGTMLAPADQTDAMWAPDGDIAPMDESGDIAVQNTGPAQLPWSSSDATAAFSYMGRMLVSTPLCVRITDPDGNPIGTYEGQFEDPPVAQLLPGVGESRLYFLVMRPTLTLPS